MKGKNKRKHGFLNLASGTDAVVGAHHLHCHAAVGGEDDDDGNMGRGHVIMHALLAW